MTRRPGMLARVGVDSDALLDFKGPSRASLTAQRAMATALEGLGVLEARNSDDLVELFDAINDLSPDAQTLWIKTLTALDGVNRIHRGNEANTSREVARKAPLPPDLVRSVDVLVVSEASGEAQGVPTFPGHMTRSGEPELTYLDSFAHSAAADAVRALRDRGNFPQGSSRHDIWDAVLQPLAQISVEATLLDRFFLTKPSGDHAKWLITNLDRSLRDGAHLRILGEWDASWTEQQARDVAHKRVAPHVGSGRIASVEVILAAAWDRSGPTSRRPRNAPYGPHNRHLRFSCGMAVTAVEGFDRLRQRTVEGVDGFTWGLVSSADRLGDLGRSEDVVASQPTLVLVHLP